MIQIKQYKQKMKKFLQINNIQFFCQINFKVYIKIINNDNDNDNDDNDR